MVEVNRRRSVRKHIVIALIALAVAASIGAVIAVRLVQEMGFLPGDPAPVLVRTLETTNPRETNIRTFLNLPAGDLDGFWVSIERVPGMKGGDWGIVAVDSSPTLLPHLQSLAPATQGTINQYYLKLGGQALMGSSPGLRLPDVHAAAARGEIWDIGAWGSSPLLHGVVIREGERVWVVVGTM